MAVTDTPPSLLPPGTADYITAGFAGAACLLLVAGNAILVKNRGYRPIRTKGVTLTVLSSVGGLIWIGCSLVVSNALSDTSDKPVLRNCGLWSFWLQGLLGVGLWSNCLTVRMFQLYYVLVRKLEVPKTPIKATMKLLVCPLLVLMLPTITLCALASGMDGVKLKGKDCKLGLGFAIALFVIWLMYDGILIFLAFTLRNVMAQWNEYRRLRRGAIAAFFASLLWLVAIDAGSYHQRLSRCFNTLSVTATVSYFFWIRNWEVLYNVLFDKEGYANRFNEELNRFDEVSNTLPRPAAAEADPMERLVLKMIDDAREYKQKLEILVLEVGDLQDKLD